MPISLFRSYNGKTRRTQNSTLLLIPVPDNSAFQSYLSSCDAQYLSSLFLNEFTEGSELTCDDTSVVVNYDTPESEYSLTMTVDDSYGTCGSFDFMDLKKMLKGSSKMWRSTCKKAVAHTLTIEPTVDCRGEEWMVQYVSFTIKNVKKVEVFVDDQKVYTVSCNVLIFAISTL